MHEILNIIKQLRQEIQSQMVNDSYFEEKGEIKPLKSKTFVPQLTTTLPKIEKKEDKVLTAPIETDRFSEMKLLFKKHAPSQFREDIPILIKLLTTEKTSFPFMQKLQDAITNSFLPAKAYHCQNDKEIKSHLLGLKFLLAPLHEMHFLNIGNINFHELAKIENNIYWLPLYPSAQYLKETELKRSLWNTLKSLSFADLLA